MKNDALIELHQVSRFYNQQAAVDSISFSVKRGEVVGFLGPNGAGKSTTMKMITGNLAPTNGRIIVNGIDLLDQPKQAKLNLGYLPEQPPLYPEQSVDEYLLYCARLNRIPQNKLLEAIYRAKERCGLDHVGTRLIGNLSKGFQQRVGIAQAIIHAPDVVILDEPTVGLDPIQIREIRALIRELGDDHSVILSTHILPEVQSICDRVLIIHQGKIIFDDAVQQLSDKMQISEIILGCETFVDENMLRAVDGVIDIEVLNSNQTCIRFHADHNPATAIARLAVENHWGLYQLCPQGLSLEEIFIQLTDEQNIETEAKSI